MIPDELLVGNVTSISSNGERIVITHDTHIVTISSTGVVSMSSH